MRKYTNHIFSFERFINSSYSKFTSHEQNLIDKSFKRNKNNNISSKNYKNLENDAELT